MSPMAVVEQASMGANTTLRDFPSECQKEQCVEEQHGIYR